MNSRLRKSAFLWSLGLACAGQALAQTAEPPAGTAQAPIEGEASCAEPVHAGESAKDLSRRFGADGKIEQVDGAEGEKVKAFVLFGKDKTRRLEVSFEDEAMIKATGLSWSGPVSKWRVAGVTLGSDVKTVRAANGGPFKINGFGRDYGGYISDFRGGKLTKLPGGCTVSLRLGNDSKDAPEALSGDGVHVGSDDPKLAAYAPVVTDITIAFH